MVLPNFYIFFTCIDILEFLFFKFALKLFRDSVRPQIEKDWSNLDKIMKQNMIVEELTDYDLYDERRLGALCLGLLLLVFVQRVELFPFVQQLLRALLRVLVRLPRQHPRQTVRRQDHCNKTMEILSINSMHESNVAKKIKIKIKIEK